MINMTDSALEKKEDKLTSLLRDFESVLVAFSGGVDSSYLLYKAAVVLGQNKVLAVTAASPLYPPEEVAAAVETASALGVKHLIIQTDELSSEDFCANPPERCYFCKTELFGLLAELAREHKIKYLLDGSNLDDTADFRPGSQAAKEMGVKSPLQEAGLTKEEIRLLSRRYGLSTWDKPAAACLASRFPYGERIDPEKLSQVDQAERFLRSMGLKRELRVRRHGSIARVEVVGSELGVILENRQIIVDYFKLLGFLYVTLDMEGFQTGSMNRVLN